MGTAALLSMEVRAPISPLRLTVSYEHPSGSRWAPPWPASFGEVYESTMLRRIGVACEDDSQSHPNISSIISKIDSERETVIREIEGTTSRNAELLASTLSTSKEVLLATAMSQLDIRTKLRSVDHPNVRYLLFN